MSKITVPTKQKELLERAQRQVKDATEELAKIESLIEGGSKAAGFLFFTLLESDETSSSGTVQMFNLSEGEIVSMLATLCKRELSLVAVEMLKGALKTIGGEHEAG